MTDIDLELDRVLRGLRSQNDILPFMNRLLAAGDTRLAPLPADMEAILAASPDFSPVSSGEPPCRLQLASGNDQAELLVYRAKTDGNLYVVAPADRDS